MSDTLNVTKLKKITITKYEYLNLRKAQLKLDMLEATGVDDWEWYGSAMNPNGEPSYADGVRFLEDEIGDIE